MDWISITANVAVLAGLVLVAIQVRQSALALQGSAYETWLSVNVELNNVAPQIDSRVFLAGNMDSRSLDEGSYTHFAMFYYSFFQMVQATNYLYRKGSLDRALWQAELGRAAVLLSLPGVRQLWDGGVSSQLTPDFVALLESVSPTQSAFAWSQERGFYGVSAADIRRLGDA